MSAHPAAAPALSAEAVAEWLEQHPDFFATRNDLLCQMHLPHETGAAVSLVERQVGLLRDRNHELRSRTQKMMDAARTNDRLFENSRKLVLTLLEAQRLEDLLITVEESLARDFQAEYHQFILFDRASFPAIGNARSVNEADARQAIGALIDSGKPVCGVLRDNERDYLFGRDGAGIQSAAIVPLKGVNTIGLLAIGSDDANRFQRQMGTLFLEYLADILGRLLPRLLEQE
ncbi:MAG TPA: DUF484 family protein [Pseudomonadales bacterium]